MSDKVALAVFVFVLLCAAVLVAGVVLIILALLRDFLVGRAEDELDEPPCADERQLRIHIARRPA